MNARLSLSALVFIVAAVIAVIVTTSGGSKSQAQSVAGANASISVKQTPLGQTLTDADGRMLYLFAPDQADMSTLSAGGAGGLAAVHRRRAGRPPWTACRRTRSAPCPERVAPRRSPTTVIPCTTSSATASRARRRPGTE